MTLKTIRIVGRGHAGSALALAFRERGFEVDGPLGRRRSPASLGDGTDFLVLAVPDSAIRDLAASIRPQPDTVVLHLSGAVGLDALLTHPRRASLHPLAPLPDPETGAKRLCSGIWFATSGDPVAGELVAALGGRVLQVAEEARPAYHAAAVVAANHVVALMGQVERIAAAAGIDFEPFVSLAGFALDDVKMLGPAQALTGPAARGDYSTIETHLATITREEREGYEAGVRLARMLAASHGGVVRDVVGAGDAGTELTGTERAGGGRDAAGIAEPGGAGAAGGVPVVIQSARAFQEALDEARRAGRTVGLVPTMGALHEGHASLVRRAASECDVVAVTVFVNPLQFNDAADLEAYPRTLERDVELAGACGAGIVFAPGVVEMYPDFPAVPLTTVHLDGLTEALEGASRPGHFDGVATVVAKCFSLAGRCRAYFGEKDYQQLLVVRRLARDLSMPVEVVACPTVREPSGLAMSSRNGRLDAGLRTKAAVVGKALRAGAISIEQGETSGARVSEIVLAALRSEPELEVEYVEVVDPETLDPLDCVAGSARLVAAVRMGGVRLIDNLGASGAAAGTTGNDAGGNCENDRL